jgi:hypothetical protein
LSGEGPGALDDPFVEILENVMQTVTVRLKISPERFQAYYQGVVEYVVAQSIDGRTIQFPARVLRPFVSHQGVQGTFEITFDATLKFQSICRAKDDM